MVKYRGEIVGIAVRICIGYDTDDIICGKGNQ